MPVAVGIIADTYNAPAGGGWTPASLGAALQGWWDTSNAGSITASGGAVSQHNDLSGLGRHLTQATGTYKPVTGTHTINGRNVFKYGTKALGFTTPGIAQPFTVSMVVGHDGLTTAQRCLGAPSAPYLSTTSGTTGRAAYGATTNVTGTGSAEVAAGAHVFTGIFNSAGAGSSFRIDGAVILTGAPGTVGLVATMYIGANASTGGSGWRETIGETVITNTALSGSDLTNLETYLKTKWGTP